MILFQLAATSAAVNGAPSLAHTDGEPFARFRLPGALDADRHPPRSSHGEADRRLVDAVSSVFRLGFVDHHTGHVHDVFEADDSIRDRLASAIFHPDT